MLFLAPACQKSLRSLLMIISKPHNTPVSIFALLYIAKWKWVVLSLNSTANYQIIWIKSLKVEKTWCWLKMMEQRLLPVLMKKDGEMQDWWKNFRVGNGIRALLIDLSRDWRRQGFQFKGRLAVDVQGQLDLRYSWEWNLVTRGSAMHSLIPT